MIITKKSLQALLAHASKDDTRPSQCGLFAHFDRSYLVATDGHRCAFVSTTTPVRELGKDMTGGVLVPRATVVAALAGAGKELEITPTEVRGGTAVPFSPGPAGFPAAFQVIPEIVRKADGLHAINADYLEEALTFVRVARPQPSARVLVRTAGDYDPVVVESVCGTALVLVMPMRL